MERWARSVIGARVAAEEVSAGGERRRRLLSVWLVFWRCGDEPSHAVHTILRAQCRMHDGASEPECQTLVQCKERGFVGVLLFTWCTCVVCMPTACRVHLVCQVPLAGAAACSTALTGLYLVGRHLSPVPLASNIFKQSLSSYTYWRNVHVCDF